MSRKYYRTVDPQDNSKSKVCGYEEGCDRIEVDPAQANLISSEVENEVGQHMPIIDLDLPCRLVASSTPGHFHLYIDQQITWTQYIALLTGFHAAGLIEDRFYDRSLERKATYARTPWAVKSVEETFLAGVDALAKVMVA